MTRQGNPWADLVEAAQARVDKATAGDTNAAREVLSHCSVALRGILRHQQLPDPERATDLQFLLDALERILNEDVDARKALSVYAGNKPKLEAPQMRDLVLFVKVGRALEELKAQGAEAAMVRTAIRTVVRNTGLAPASEDTVRKAWQRMGGARAWRRQRKEWE